MPEEAPSRSRQPEARSTARRPLALADARRGDVVVISEILFDLVRNHCWDLGIKAGEVFVCRDREGGELHLEHEDLGTVRLDLERARFVSVEPMVAVA